MKKESLCPPRMILIEICPELIRENLRALDSEWTAKSFEVPVQRKTLSGEQRMAFELLEERARNSGSQAAGYEGVGVVPNLYRPVEVQF